MLSFIAGGIRMRLVAQLGTVLTKNNAPGNVHGTLPSEAAFPPTSHRGDFEKMARRRFQQPKPFQEGQFWWLRVWDTNQTGSRKRQRIKFAPVQMPAREVQKIAEEKLRPVNSGLALTGSAMTLSDFVTSTYNPTFLPLLSSSTQDSYRGMIAKYLEPRFGRLCLRDLTRLTISSTFQQWRGACHIPRFLKFRDALSSILRSAVDMRLPQQKSHRRIAAAIGQAPTAAKPTITPQEFNALVQLVAEPYATMLYIAVWTGLRVSELIGLKWRCIHDDSISVEERFCRGDGLIQKPRQVLQRSTFRRKSSTE